MSSRWHHFEGMKLKGELMFWKVGSKGGFGSRVQLVSNSFKLVLTVCSWTLDASTPNLSKMPLQVDLH